MSRCSGETCLHDEECWVSGQPPEPATWPAVQAVRFALDRADHREGRRGAFLRTLDAVGLGFDS